MILNLQNILVVSLIALLTACGNPPLIAPESTENIAQSEQAVQAEPPATLVIVGGNANSPLASPIVSVEPTESPTSRATETPRSTATQPPPTQPPQPTPTQPPQPTCIPSPPLSTATLEPSKTATPKETVTVNGYIFSLPQEIPSTRQISGVEIVNWLPGSSNEVLLKGTFNLGVLNIETGEVTVYATVEEPGNIRFPAWIPDAQAAAYFSWDIQTNQQNLWLGQAGSNDTGVKLLSDVNPPLIPLNEGLAVYSSKNNAIQGVSSDGQDLSISSDTSTPLSSTELEQLGTTARYTDVQPGGEWVAITRHNSVGGVQFFNTKTGETHLIDLGGEEPTPLWALNAKWSPDGQKLALIVTQGPPTISFSDLYILDWPAATLRKVEDTFTFVNDITWAPDSKNLLFKAVVDRKDDFIVNALYIIDVSADTENTPLPIPSEGLSNSFGGAVSWSPDGQRLLVMYSDELGVALYQIKVDVVVQ